MLPSVDWRALYVKWCYVQVVTDNKKLQVAYADFYYTDQEGRITGRTPSRWLDYKHLLARNPGDWFSECCISVFELCAEIAIPLSVVCNMCSRCNMVHI